MRTSDGAMHDRRPRKSRRQSRARTRDEKIVRCNYTQIYPAQPKCQSNPQTASYPFISNADFGLDGDIGNTDEDFTSYKNKKCSRPFDNVSNLESGNEKVMRVRPVRAKDTD